MMNAQAQRLGLYGFGASAHILAQLARWQGRARLRNGKIEIEKGKLVSPAGAYDVGGTASLGRVLDFKLARSTDMRSAGAGALAYSITGTVAEPRVALTPTPETQARLKP